MAWLGVRNIERPLERGCTAAPFRALRDRLALGALSDKALARSQQVFTTFGNPQQFVPDRVAEQNSGRATLVALEALTHKEVVSLTRLNEGRRPSWTSLPPLPSFNALRRAR